MARMKIWITLAAVAVVLIADVTFALTRGGDGTKHVTTGQHVSTGQAGGAAPAAPSGATAQQVQDMLQSITSQLQQAANNGGQPRAVTAEEVEAMLRQQQQQLGIK